MDPGLGLNGCEILNCAACWLGQGVAEDPQNCTQFPSWKADNENASRWMDEVRSIAPDQQTRIHKI